MVQNVLINTINAAKSVLFMCRLSPFNTIFSSSPLYYYYVGLLKINGINICTYPVSSFLIIRLYLCFCFFYNRLLVCDK